MFLFHFLFWETTKSNLKETPRYVPVENIFTRRKKRDEKAKDEVYLSGEIRTGGLDLEQAVPLVVRVATKVSLGLRNHRVREDLEGVVATAREASIAGARHPTVLGGEST